ncbi:hypothetical protein, partial [Croceicoccus hydrothermalis]|uniref:hypothetical protein n=1 Tax=Croceicoccus hydrothermalis TaxID=2867964 RepID=UPI001EFB15DE
CSIQALRPLFYLNRAASTPPRSGSCTGPETASNASLAQNPSARNAFAPSASFLAFFWVVHRSWKREHTLPRDFGR